MNRRVPVGAEAVAAKGWWRAHKWLVARRASQFGLLALFLLGPLAGIWIIKGNLNASLTLGVLPLGDPLVLLQTLAAGHLPVRQIVIGALIVAVFYALVGGRVYCAWVCPINPVTDAAYRLRERLGIAPGWQPPHQTRLWILAMVLVVSAAGGIVAWELVNPISMLHRGLLYGIGFAWTLVLAVFLFDLLVSQRGWCGRICPVGAFYGLLGHFSLVRVRADQRSRCDDCMDCVAVCPEPRIIMPVVKGEGRGVPPVILAQDCSNCGRCIDVCAEEVFAFGTRRHTRTPCTGSRPHPTSVADKAA